MLFSVNALLYGDYPDLAERCLGSLSLMFNKGYVKEFRIGLNAVSTRTRKVAETFAEKSQVTCLLYTPNGGKNVGKYPLMRRMFYDVERPVMSRYLMWFDDDSYYTEERSNIAKEEWWQTLVTVLNFRAVCGSLYRPAFEWSDTEIATISKQSWYSGVSINTKPVFATGGWWAARREFLADWDYPFPQLHHNGGDVLLGELCRQQPPVTGDTNVGMFRTNLRINADFSGRESGAKRRGITTPRPYVAGSETNVVDPPHQHFPVRVETFAC